MTETPTDAEILDLLKRIDAMPEVASNVGLAQDAAICIRWLQAGVGAAELDCETKRGAIAALTEGRGLPDEDLWATLKKERDQAVMLLPAITAEIKSLNSQREALRVACQAALTELVYLAEQVKAREGGSVMRAIRCCKNALACPECGGSGTVVKASPLAQGIADTYQEPCGTCAGKGATA